MAQALALLRFIYDRGSLTRRNIGHLSLHDNLGGVLRLAHGLDCAYIFKECKAGTYRLVTPDDFSGFRKGFLYDPEMPSKDLVKFDLVKDIRSFAVDTKDEYLQEACYNYLALRCNKITKNAMVEVQAEDSMLLLRDLSDCPELLRAAMFFLMRRNPRYTGRTITRVLDNESYIPPALFTFKFQITMGNGDHWIDPIDEDINGDFWWNDYPYSIYIHIEEGMVGYHINLEEMPENEPGPKVEIKVRLLHWSELASSITKTKTHEFPDMDDSVHLFGKKSEIARYLDEDNVLYLQVLDVTVLETPPPTVANPPLEGEAAPPLEGEAAAAAAAAAAANN